jgi:hypothetical protein
LKILIKSSLVLGTIAGAILGVLLALPFIQCLVFILFLFLGAAVVYYLKKNSFVGMVTIKQGAIAGAISGFAGFSAAYICYLPISFIFHLIFKSFNLKSGFDILNSFMFTSFTYFIGIMAIIFALALLIALFSAFSGLIAAYIYLRIEEPPPPDSSFDFKINQ